jgi:predicted ATPase
LRLALGGARGSAEESYQQSRDMAQHMGASMVELQVETRLLRLRRARGEDDDGAALRAVYDRFTEGFATRDLSEARELLA